MKLYIIILNIWFVFQFTLAVKSRCTFFMNESLSLPALHSEMSIPSWWGPCTRRVPTSPASTASGRATRVWSSTSWRFPTTRENTSWVRHTGRRVPRVLQLSASAPLTGDISSNEGQMLCHHRVFKEAEEGGRQHWLLLYISPPNWHTARLCVKVCYSICVRGGQMFSLASSALLTRQRTAEVFPPKNSLQRRRHSEQEQCRSSCSASETCCVVVTSTES